MITSNIGFKSALLALSVMVAAPVSTVRGSETVEVVSKTVSSTFGSIQPLPVAMTVAFALWVRLQTKSDKEQFKTNAKDDYKKLTQSFDLLDTEFYQHLGMLFDKYIVGQKIKFVQKDIPQEDGSTVKGKKTISQEPRGALGLFDAYVLSQVKGFAEQIPAIAGLYVLLGSPELPWQKELKKAAQ